MADDGRSGNSNAAAAVISRFFCHRPELFHPRFPGFLPWLRGIPPALADGAGALLRDIRALDALREVGACAEKGSALAIHQLAPG